MMRAGHISLPNGLGVTEHPDAVVVGVSPNELTTSDHRDPVAGTPYHKYVPARLARTDASELDAPSNDRERKARP